MSMTEEEFYKFLFAAEESKEFKHTLKLMISAEHSKYELLDILMTLINEYASEKGLSKLMDQYPKLSSAVLKSISMTILKAEEREEKEG